jgi:UDP-N-acetylglucosamine acyltransferase
MSNSNGLNFIHPNAKIGTNSTIGPFTYIEGDVVIGDNCWIGPNVNIMDGARIGDNCKIFPGAVISAVPQDLKYKGEPTLTIIGNNVIIRECCTLNRGTIALGYTKIGDNCLLMAYVHVAHDCIISERCVLANNVTLAGHIEIGKNATLGGMVAVHQFVRIGEHSIIGGGSLVRKDVPPFVTAAREPLSYAGINSIGLSRRGFSKEEMHHIENIYRILFVRGLSIRRALNEIEEEIEDSIYKAQILTFVKDAKRGLMKGFRSLNTNKVAEPALV